jgi:hypothetical protein
MTAWQLKLCIAAYHEKEDQKHRHDVAMAWHAANFYRAAKLPKLSVILDRLKAPLEKPEESGIIGIMKTQMARRGR